MKKHVVRKNIFTIQFSHISFTQTPTHTIQMLLKEASLHGPPSPPPERRCFHIRRPEWSETGQSGRSPLIPAELVLSPLHASRRMPPARLPLESRRLGRQTPKCTRPSTLNGGGVKPQDPVSNHPREPLQCHQARAPDGVGHRKRPASPFGTHGEDVEGLGLDDAVHDIRHHHLQCSGRGRQEKSHRRPRHAI